MPSFTLTPEIIHAAIDGFESQKRRIDEQITDLRAMLPGGRTETAAAPETPTRERRKLSAAARKRIGDAQRKRWAASKGQSETKSAPVTATPKRKLSMAGKAAIVAALKKRWAAKSAAGKKAAPAKKSAVNKSTPAKDRKKTGANKAAKTPEAKAAAAP